MPTMGERIRQKRKGERLSLRAMAAAANVSTGFLCDVEHDKRNCSVAVASRIAEALKIDVGWLIGTSPRERTRAYNTACVFVDAKIRAEFGITEKEATR